MCAKEIPRDESASGAVGISGVRMRAIRTLAYVVTGALAALAGRAIASQLGESHGDLGQNVELGVITIVIVGGNAVSGGEGAMWRTAAVIAILPCSATPSTTSRSQPSGSKGLRARSSSWPWRSTRWANGRSLSADGSSAQRKGSTDPPRGCPDLFDPGADSNGAGTGDRWRFSSQMEIVDSI